MIIGVLSLPVTYLVWAGLIGRRNALWAIALLSTNALHVYYSQDAKMYAAVWLLATLSSGAYLHALEDRSHKGAWLIVYGASNAASLLTSYVGVVPLAIQIIHGLIASLRRKPIAVRVAIAAALSCLPAIVWLPTELRVVKQRAGISWIPPISGGRFSSELSDAFGIYLLGYRTIPNSPNDICGMFFYYIHGLATLLAFAAVLVYLVGLNTRRKEVRCATLHSRSEPTLYLALWAFLPAIGAFVFSIAVVPIWGPARYLMASGPAIILLVASALGSLPFRRLACVAGLILIAANSSMIVYEKTHVTADPYRAMVSVAASAAHSLPVTLNNRPTTRHEIIIAYSYDDSLLKWNGACVSYEITAQGHGNWLRFDQLDRAFAQGEAFFVIELLPQALPQTAARERLSSRIESIAKQSPAEARGYDVREAFSAEVRSDGSLPNPLMSHIASSGSVHPKRQSLVSVSTPRMQSALLHLPTTALDPTTQRSPIKTGGVRSMRSDPRPREAETMEQTGTGEGVIYPLLVVATVVGASIYANLFPAAGSSDMTLHLGGEYRCIAEALANGRGFSDPFGFPTGSTAWMPPVLPLLLAGLMKFLGSFEAVGAVVLTLQNLVLIYAGLLVIRTASGPVNPKAFRAVAFAAYAVAIGSQFYYLFQFTHDHWIVLFWVCVFFDLADRFYARKAGAVAVGGWGVAGGLAVLTAPVLGPVWAALTLTLAVAINRIRPFAFSTFVAVMVVAPWMVRNALVFHRFIPVKSNLAFELYQSQCLEPDGVLRQNTAFIHPYLSAGDERKLYVQEGEMSYLEQKRTMFLESVRAEPLSFVERVGRRFAAATVAYVPYDASEGADSKLARTLLHPLPFVGLVLTLANRGWRSDRRKTIAIVIYVTYITPYIIISYYIRYTMPLLLIKAMFCLWGWQSVCQMKARWDYRRELVSHHA